MNLPAVDSAKRALIASELDRIEREEDIRIALAVESGSRAWGHPSPDSDYDVRFIYVRRPEAYLSIEPVRDVIERPISDELDIGGWDLGKALALMVRSNAVAHEWLVSPVVYRAQPILLEALRAFASETADRPSLAYHYDRLARSSFAEIRGAAGTVRLKKYFYALRPAVALVWLRTQSDLPPMDLPSLLSGIDLGGELRDAISQLLGRKAISGEATMIDREALIDAFLEDVLRDQTPTPGPRDRMPSVGRANAIFAQAVLNPLR
jgi:predicted nucleotidyltransferase